MKLQSKLTVKMPSIYDICFAFSAIAMLVILVAIPQKMNNLVSLGTYAIGGCAIVVLVVSFMDDFRRINLKEICLILLIAVTFFALYISYTGTPEHLILDEDSELKNHLVALLCFFEIPIFMVGATKLKSKGTIQVFLWTQYILSFYYLYLSRTDKAYFFEGQYSDIYLDELTLSYHNPNEASIYLTCCFFTLLIGTRVYKKLFPKILFWINAVAVLRLVLLTQSRAGTVSCILGLAFYFLYKMIPISKLITRIALFAPLVMAFLIYFFNEELSNVKFLGSAFDTDRKNVFDRVFENLELYEIFAGDFQTHLFGNLHNMYISIFATIGIFGVIFYILYCDTLLVKLSEKDSVLPYQKIAYLCVLMLIIYSSVESALFCSGSAFAMNFISVFMLFVFENPDNNQIEEQTQEKSYKRFKSRKHRRLL